MSRFILPCRRSLIGTRSTGRRCWVCRWRWRLLIVTTPTVVQQPVVVQQQPVVVQQPTVVQQPVVQRQPVWVEGRYVDQVQANGSTVRIWQPGHYE